MSHSLGLYSSNGLHSYYIFHPWSKELDQKDHRNYWITFVVISVFTCFLAPLFYYAFQAVSKLLRTPEEPDFSGEKDSKSEDLYKLLKQEISLTTRIERVPTNKGWLKHEPFDQSFEYSTEYHRASDDKPLYIQLIGKFSATDLKIISLVIEFVRAFHCVDVRLIEKTLQMEELKNDSKTPFSRTRNWGKREVVQYLADDALDALKIMKEDIEEPCHLMAFTSEFLYSRGLDNFVFGLGSHGGAGIFSNFLFGNPEESFYKVLARMNKIAAHEFGHVYFIAHCSAHECNIGGYMTLEELDSRPFYYCSKDTAKLCMKKGITLKTYYTHLLEFFTQFQDQHQNDFFKKEIVHVQKKLKILSQNAHLYNNG